MLTRMYFEMWALKEGVKERARETLRRLHEKKDGAAIVEYGILIAGIAVAVIAIIFAIGGTIANMFQSVNQALIEETATTPPG